MSLPLTGVRVIDPTSGMVGPYTAMFLADMGADVIHVEPPEGDSARTHAGFRTWNRGKRSVILDPSASDTASTAIMLMQRSDVLIDDGNAKLFGFPPFEDASTINPRIIYCSILPYGTHGPYLRHNANEHVAQALSGLMCAQGSMGGGPVFLNLPLVSSYTAILAAAGVCEALYVREHVGLGQQVILTSIGVGALLVGSIGATSDRIPRRSTRSNPYGTQPAYRLYRTKDKEWIVVACTNHVFWNRFCIALDHHELLTDPRYEHAPWGIPLELHDNLVNLFQSIIGSKTRDEWLEIFMRHDVPAAPVMSRNEYMKSDLVRANSLEAVVIDPEVGAVRQMGNLLHVDGAPKSIRGPAPRLGEHTADVQHIASERARSPGSVVSTRAKAYALDGIRVLDFSTYLAGPICGMLLADGGAVVIKVEPLTGEGYRSGGLSCLGLNRGKKGLAIDLQRDLGRAVILDLIRQTDVVLESFRPGVTERLGLDYSTASSINSRIVYCSITGYGAYKPLAAAPAFDPLFQARSGQMIAQGGRGHDPVFHSLAINDYATGFLAYYGIMLGLYQRERTGRGCHVTVTQAAAALAIQSEEVTRYRGVQPPPEGGPDLLGWTATYRLYQAADGWVFVGIQNTDDWIMFCTVISRPDMCSRFAAADAVSAPVVHPIAAELADIIRSRPLGDWARLGQSCRLPIVPVIDVQLDLPRVPLLEENELLVHHAHPLFGTISTIGLILKFSLTPGHLQGPAPWVGEHNTEVLQAFGYTNDTITRLQQAGVVASPPFKLY